jgi:tetratricopeptide (TPR) repeat protein
MKCLNNLYKKNLIFIFIIIIFFTGSELRSDSIKEIDKRAEEYYNNKEFNKAISEWLSILEIDPKNEEIQKKIETVYDEKQKKDTSFQVAKIQLKLAKRSVDSNLKDSNTKTDMATNNFIIAYRIDPKDPELQILKDDLRDFKKILEVENRKTRLSEAMKAQYMALLPVAREKMRQKEYEEALKIWKELLSIVPLDTVAKEGKRQAELAIENRLKYERLIALLESGVSLFNQKKYQEAEIEFKQALDIDSANKEGKSYLEKIKDILEEKRNAELIKIQVEQLYTDGIENLKKKNFDRAKENFENIISLVDDYKDVKNRLQSIDRLRKEWEEQQRIARLRTIDTQFEKGLVALNDSRYKDAIIAFEAVLTLDPKNDLAKRYIQTAKEAQEQIEEERVTEDSPYYNIINPYMVSGKLLYDKGEYSESRRRWEKILDLFPKNKIATEYLLRCNIKINPDAFADFLSTYINDGRAFLKDKRYRLALAKFEMIKSIQNNYPGIDGLIANAKAGLAKRPALAANVSQNEIDKRLNLGIDFYRKGGEENIKLALREFKWVNANDPENTSALVYTNKIESQLRVGNAPVAAVQKLTDRQKKLVDTYYFRGINHYANNRFDDAIGEWRKVLAIDPDNEKAKMNIQRCLALLKR